KPFTAAVAQGADLRGALETIRRLGGDKYKDADKLVNVPQGGALIDPLTQKPVFTNPRTATPTNPTEASLAAEAADPTNPKAAQAAAALKLLRADKDADNVRADELAKAQIGNYKSEAAHRLAQEAIDRARLAKGEAPAKARNVTSGDANRIADYNSSLSDLEKLKTELTNVAGATGAAAKAGAMLPNAITEYTGIGQQAKQKQAVIDRVKQVIGKAMEGGVLR